MPVLLVVVLVNYYVGVYTIVINYKVKTILKVDFNFKQVLVLVDFVYFIFYHNFIEIYGNKLSHISII